MVIGAFDRAGVLAELASTRETFTVLTSQLTAADVRRPSNGTRWTNDELLFHMLFGYAVVWPLVLVISVFDRLPPIAGSTFAGILNRAVRPFNLVNYWGSRAGSRILTPARMDRVATSVIRAWENRVRSSRDRTVARAMCFPTAWDPFFSDHMSIGDLYHYPTQHFRFHQQQLALMTETPSE